MSLRTYQAYTMTEALAAVKRDLGPDAVILQTRSFRRGGFFGLGRRTVVEVTAGVGEAVAKPAARPRNARAAERAYTVREPEAPVTDADRDRTRKLAQAMLESRAARGVDAVEVTPAPTEVAPRPAEHMEPVEVPPAASEVAQRFVLHPTPAPERTGPARVWDGAPPAPAEVPLGSVHDELAAIRQMVGNVLERQAAAPASGGEPADLPPGALFDLYLRLVGQDLSEELADRIVREAREDVAPADLDDPEVLRRAVGARLASYVPIADAPVPEASTDGRPLTIALVGPTGVGKTTTVAKLAAAFKLRHGRRVGLITADTYRIAAVEQLRTYANIIGVPLHVALTPEDMEHATAALAECDVILIDTAGRSQNDTQRLAELRAFIGAADPHEVHLVLSGTAGEKVLLREAEAFDVVGIDKVVLTKLDEAVSFGMLIDVVRRIGKSLSFFTTGQEVPEHLEIGRSQRLVDLVLGEDAVLEPRS